MDGQMGGATEPETVRKQRERRPELAGMAACRERKPADTHAERVPTGTVVVG